MITERTARGALLLLAAVGVVSGIVGGLVRLGMPLVASTPVMLHGALMICGFLGTVIALERAVALGGPLALSAPTASGIGTLFALMGFVLAAAMLWLAASLLLLAASVAIVQRQPQPHAVLLAVAALGWGIGNALLLGGRLDLAVAWWFTFLVLTIVAERLELSRLLPRRRAARPTFIAAVGALLAGALLSVVDARIGAIVFGASLIALAAWLVVFDLARRTVRFAGLARFAAIALLAGYAWLAVGGAAWIGAFGTGMPRLRDASLHALGLGFVVSMIIAHAPIVLPAVLGIRVRFTGFFYAPLGLLHASVLLRLLAGYDDPAWRFWGGALNAVVFVLFFATLAFSSSARTRLTSPGAG